MSANATKPFFSSSPNQSGVMATAVTTSDTANLPFITRFLFVGGAGNLAVQFPNGTNCTFTGVTAGTQIPLCVAKVLATGTTATNIVAVY